MRQSSSANTPSATRRYRAVVFDFDGTLAHLNLDFERMRSGVAELALEFSLSPAPHDGAPLLEWLQETAKKLEQHAEATQAEQLLKRAHELIRDMEVEAATKGGLFSFTRPLLTALRRAKTPVGIITRNCSPALQTVFPDVLDYADCVLTRDDVSRVKPSPEHLGQALAELQCSSDGALMVGDHPIDMATGRNAGVRSAGVASGRVSMEDLAAAGAQHVARDSLALCKELSRKGLLPLLAI